MNIPSIVSNSYFKGSSQVISAHKPSMFSTPIEQFYQYNSIPVPVLTYPEYPTNNYNISDNYFPPQEPMVSTIKIHINPYFKPQSLNQMNKPSSEIHQQRKHNSSSSSSSPSSSQSSSSRSRSRSPSVDRQVIISSNKNRQERQNRKFQREKFIQEKELIFKWQSSSFSKSKPLHPSPDRWEHKDDKLKRLYQQYSTEDTFKHWKPLLLKDCFELYQYAFEKYYQRS